MTRRRRAGDILRRATRLTLVACLPLLCWPGPVVVDVTAREGCAASTVAGEYRTSFGPLACEATEQGLSCCYGPACQNTMELVYDQAAAAMSGTWRYPNGTHGPVVFPVSPRCALASGRWNHAERATRWQLWAITGRAVASGSAPVGVRSPRATSRSGAGDGASRSVPSPGSESAVAGRAELRISKDVYAPGERLEIEVESVADITRAWVTIARPEDGPRQYVRRIRLGTATTVKHTLLGLRPGEYEVRLFEGKVDEVVARRRLRIAEAAAQQVRPQEGPSPTRGPAPRAPDTSCILELYDTGAERSTLGARRAPQLDLTGYRRPDMLGYIYDGKFELVPATGLDNIRYYAQVVGSLASRCPALPLDAAKHQLIPYLVSGATDLVRRFQTNQLSQSEALQAVWMAMLGLNQHWSCQYNPRREARDHAQARCDEAAKDIRDLGVMPSHDAALDTTLFLGQHGCDSEAAQHLARQLIAFGRIAHTRTHLTERMPSPTSATGKAYAAVFENCARSSLNDRDYAWCGCYVRTLHALKPTDQLLHALAQNPFVDAATYISWVVQNVPGGQALLQCESTLSDWRESYAPRPTACLIDDRPTSGGARECRYRAAFGVFTLTDDQCEREISSRRWGYREVDCRAAGVVAAPLGPREWRKGVFTIIDYENELAPNFVPPLPPDARAKQPLQVRLLKRDTPGLLRSMSLTVLTQADLARVGMPLNLGEVAGVDLAAIGREGALVLKCTYKGDRGVRTAIYWFDRTPRYVRDRRVHSALQPYFSGIGGSLSSCPLKG